jgi:hypothetical protein
MKHSIAWMIVFAAGTTVATSASAGEVKAGHGGAYIAGSDGAALHGKSACAFSGLNDDYYIGDDLDAARTQSWGQDVRGGFVDPQSFAGDHTSSPITFCNPNVGFPPE